VTAVSGFVLSPGLFSAFCAGLLHAPASPTASEIAHTVLHFGLMETTP
jgi:hypothetical protein